jgi:formiminotetrahydrofolate cyclodeaminase
MSEPGRSVAEMTIDAFTRDLASDSPTPGGGSAAAVAAALAASLAAMVVRISLGRTDLAQHADLFAEALAASDVLRSRFLELATEDASAYSAYREARRLPHATEAEAATRTAASRDAARGAAAIPLALVEACHRQAGLVERLAGRTLTSVASDLVVAALLLESAARGAAANVVVNLPAVEDERHAADVTARLELWLGQIEADAARTREYVGANARRGPETA